MNDELKSGPACDPTLSRAEFLRLLVERATIAGALMIGPCIADAFAFPVKPPFLLSGQTTFGLGGPGGQTSTSLADMARLS